MPYHSGNELIDPYIIFDKAQLRPGMHAADFGCGKTGHILFPAAVIIGEHGVIYGVDIMKDDLAIIAKHAALERLHNIHTIWSDIERIGATAIPAGSLDLIFLINILHAIHDRTNALAEATRLLKDKSRLVLVDWKANNLPIGPKPEKLVDFTAIAAWAAENKYVVQEEFEAGKYHNGVVLYRV